MNYGSCFKFVNSFLWGVGIVVWVAAVTLGPLFGPEWSRKQMREVAVEDDRQTVAACLRLDIAEHDPKFAACKMELVEAGRSHVERVQKLEAGLL